MKSKIAFSLLLIALISITGMIAGASSDKNWSIEICLGSACCHYDSENGVSCR